MVCGCVQALLDGFHDRAAVDEYTAQQGNQTLGEDKIKVALGTLRTKVLVQESECEARVALPLILGACDLLRGDEGSLY